MANMSVAEPRVILPLGTQVEVQALGQTLFTARAYEIFRHEAEYTLYGRFQESSEKNYYICDLLLVSHIAASKVEEAVPKIDAKAEHLRQELLSGKSPWKDIVVKKHPFMRLHRPLIQYSYVYNEKAVRFHIRPLLLVPESENPWDYYMGATSRVDIVSLEGKTLVDYLKEHAKALQNIQPLDLKKYYYPKIAQKLIDYGHFPIIILWILAFFFAALQIPFLDLTGLFLLTIFPYLGLLGTIYLLHQWFAHANQAELSETAPFQATRSTPVISQMPDTPVENLVLDAIGTANREVSLTQDSAIYEEPRATTIHEGPRAIAPTFKELPPINASSPITTIHNLISNVMAIKEPEDLNESATQLLFAVLQFVLKKKNQEIPKTVTKLPELLKLLRTDNAFNLFYRALSLWATKLDTQTPFDRVEMAKFKRDLLYWLFGLRLLPEELSEIMKRGPPTKNSADSQPLDARLSQVTPPSPTLVIKTASPELRTKDKLDQEGLQSGQGGSLAEKVILPEESPDIEVDSQIYIEIPEVNRVQFQQMREKDPNGIYCALFIDKKSPEFQEIAQEFELITKHYDDAHRIFIGADQIDSFLDQELFQTPLPVVMVGYGFANKQILRYKGSQDNRRLNSLISNYLQRKTDINEDIDREPEKMKVESKDYQIDSETENLISLKMRQGARTEKGNPAISQGARTEKEKVAINQGAITEEENAAITDSKEANPRKSEGELPEIWQKDKGQDQLIRTERVEFVKNDLNALIKEEGIPQQAIIQGEQRVQFIQNQPFIQVDQPIQANQPIQDNEFIQGELSSLPQGLQQNAPRKLIGGAGERLVEEEEIAKAEENGSSADGKQGNAGQDSECEGELIQKFPFYRQKLVLSPNLNEIELVAVDGTNLLYLLKDYREAGREPRLECIHRVMDMLIATGFAEERIAVFFDANINETFGHFKRAKDALELESYIAQGKTPKFRKVTGGIKADTGLIALGNNSKNFIIVTNDGLKEYSSALRHRVAVTLDLNNVPRLLVTSMQDLFRISYGKG